MAAQPLFDSLDTVVDLSPAWMDQLQRYPAPRKRRPWVAVVLLVPMLLTSGAVSYANAWVDGVPPPPREPRVVERSEPRKVMVMPAQALHLDLSSSLPKSSRGGEPARSSRKSQETFASIATPKPGALPEPASKRAQREEAYGSAALESKGSPYVQGKSIRLDATAGAGGGTSTHARAEREVELDGRDTAHIDSSGQDLERAYVPQALLKRVLGSLDQQIRYCYDASGGTSKGRVTADLSVVPPGRIEAVDTSGSSLNNRQVRDCIEKVLLRSRFPAGSVRQAATITYYWDFGGR